MKRTVFVQRLEQAERVWALKKKTGPRSLSRDKEYIEYIVRHIFVALGGGCVVG